MLIYANILNSAALGNIPGVVMLFPCINLFKLLAYFAVFCISTLLISQQILFLIRTLDLEEHILAF